MTSAFEGAPVLSVARDFSKYPAGRVRADGPFPGEVFREKLVAALEKGKRLIVDLDGTNGYGSSFLEEAFGGLVRKCGFTMETLKRVLDVRCASDSSFVDEVWTYIENATPDDD